MNQIPISKRVKGNEYKPIKEKPLLIPKQKVVESFQQSHCLPSFSSLQNIQNIQFIQMNPNFQKVQRLQRIQQIQGQKQRVMQPMEMNLQQHGRVLASQTFSSSSTPQPPREQEQPSGIPSVSRTKEAKVMKLTDFNLRTNKMSFLTRGEVNKRIDDWINQDTESSYLPYFWGL